MISDFVFSFWVLSFHYSVYTYIFVDTFFIHFSSLCLIRFCGGVEYLLKVHRLC